VPPARFQESTNRLTIKFSASEGAPGTITAYIIPAMPPKTCAAIEVPLLPLCMHQLLPSPGLLLQQRGVAAPPQGAEACKLLLAQLQEERPFSELVLQGPLLCVAALARSLRRACHAAQGKAPPAMLLCAHRRLQCGRGARLAGKGAARAAKAVDAQRQQQQQQRQPPAVPPP
jgi:hypothetical protein